MSCCNLPDTIGAGLTFNRLLTLTAYPAPEWVLTVLLRGKQTVDLVATADGSQHRLSATAAQTATWLAGDYWYSMRATRGDDVVEVETGSITVMPDMLTLTDGYDGRSQAQVALDAINAVLAKRATLDQQRYRINNRELYRESMTELLKLRSFYRLEVKREQQKACGKNPFGGVVRVRLQ